MNREEELKIIIKDIIHKINRKTSCVIDIEIKGVVEEVAELSKTLQQKNEELNLL